MPDFKHPIVEKLYEVDYFIDRAILQEILDLGKEVIPDLEKIVLDSIERFDEYKEDDFSHHFQMSHALNLLQDLEAEQSLELVLSLTDLPLETLEWWYSDYIFQEYPPLVAKLALNQPEKLIEYLQSSSPRLFKSMVQHALAVVVHLKPHHREQVLSYYQGFLEKTLQNANQLEQVFTERLEPEYDLEIEEYLGYLVGYLKDSGFTELYPQIRELFRLDLISGMITSLEIWENGPLPIKLPQDTFEKYESYKKGHFAQYSPFNPDYEKLKAEREKKEKNWSESLKLGKKSDPVKVEKVGRNDPCPCGSGKKYKKCCG